MIALQVDRLKELRETHGWSQRELSRMCGLDVTLIGKYERGEIDPSAITLKLMAEKLGVSADYLIGLSDDPHSLSDSSELSEDERAIVEAFRCNGWPGVARVMSERMGG